MGRVPLGLHGQGELSSRLSIGAPSEHGIVVYLHPERVRQVLLWATEGRAVLDQQEPSPTSHPSLQRSHFVGCESGSIGGSALLGLRICDDEHPDSLERRQFHGL